MARAATPDQIIKNARPQFVVAPQPRTAATAKADNDMTGRVNRAIAAMSVFADHIYTIEDGVHKYVSSDGVVLITTPFSKTGYTHYKISRSEGRTLNRIYRHMQTVDKRLPWLIYDEILTRWTVDLVTYPTLTDAAKWIRWCNLQRQFPMEWHALTDSRYTAN